MKQLHGLGKRIRGWVPKEHIVYGIKRTITSKGIAIYFSLLFIIGVLIPAFVTPLFLPSSLIPTVNESILMLLFVGTMLALVYYIRTRATPRQVRLFFFVGIGGGLGFPVWAGAMLLSKALTGNYFEGFDVQLAYVLSFAVAFVIGIPASKGLQKRLLQSRGC